MVTGLSIRRQFLFVPLNIAFEMKVAGGLVGITLNENARVHFFLTAPQLKCLADEAKTLVSVKTKSTEKHHSLSAQIISRQLKYTENMISTFNNFMNPFTNEGADLINLLTKSAMEESIKEDMKRQDKIGQNKFELFCTERIKSNSVSLWALMKKAERKTFKTASKQVKVKVKDTVTELKEDQGLFACMLIVACSRQEIDLKGSLSKYEFSVVPRVLFSSDGSMHHCPKKSDLMKILEAIPPKEGSNGAASQHQQNLSDMKVAIVDGMAEVQAIHKPSSIKTCKDLGEHFESRIKSKFGTYDEVHVIFDDYTVKNSLKTATRSKRLSGLASVRSRITDSTKIQHIPMKKLLYHESTKDELTMFFPEKIMHMAMKTGQQYVVVWRQHVDSSIDSFCHASSHEEADTKIIFHAIKAKERGATQLDVYSPDTDVFILLIRKYPQLPKETSFVTGRGTQQRRIQIKNVYDELGPAKAAALPGFHAFTGADITGSFAGKGKLQCWKIFNQAD